MTSSESEPAAVPREHFIPLRADDLAHLLANSDLIENSDRRAFLNLCRILKSVFHFQYHEELLRLKRAYAPFDPDKDTVTLHWPDDVTNEEQSTRFFDTLVGMFERANFRRLNRVQLEDAFKEGSEWGLNLEVDFTIFDRLELFARGETTIKRDHRDWRNFYRLEQREVKVHQRLVVAFRLKEGVPKRVGCPGSVTLKLFKEIPRGDLEMLLPGTRVRMTLFDRVKIALPTVSGLILTAYKIIRSAVVLTFAGAYGILGFIGFVGGTIGYGVKSFFGYLRTKDKYQADLTRNLYYQNLDNNAGVLFRLLDEVEEQEFREAILAYALLQQPLHPNGMTFAELDEAAERLLFAATDMDVDFEVSDAIEKLKRLELVHERNGHLKAVPVYIAQMRLDAMWDSFYVSVTEPTPKRRAA
jgi:hypothetical protein